MDKENKRKIIIISLIALTLIVVTVIVSLIYLNYKTKSKPEENQEQQTSDSVVDFSDVLEEDLEKFEPNYDLSEEELHSMYGDAAKDPKFTPPPKID
jgi:uncharacterized protein YpmB